MVIGGITAAPSSSTNSQGERDPEMHQTKKGNQWHFGMKAHIGVDADSGLIQTVVGTTANVLDVTQGHKLLHGQETVAFADAGYRAKRRAQKDTPWGALMDQAEKLKSSVRSKVEHVFRVVKCQFGFTKVRYRGLAKNTAQLVTLFALSNLWKAEWYLCGGRYRDRCT